MDLSVGWSVGWSMGWSIGFVHWLCPLANEQGFYWMLSGSSTFFVNFFGTFCI
jgi:hypothetical protein